MSVRDDIEKRLALSTPWPSVGQTRFEVHAPTDIRYLLDELGKYEPTWTRIDPEDERTWAEDGQSVWVWMDEWDKSEDAELIYWDTAESPHLYNHWMPANIPDPPETQDK